MNSLLNWFTPNKQTWLHRCNPSLKFVALFAIMLFVFFSRAIGLYVGYIICLSIVLWSSSGFPARKVALLHIPILISSLSSGITLTLFGRGNDIIWQWWIIKISHESIHSGMMIGTKSLLIGIISLLLLLTSPPVKLLYSFMQQLRLPAKYAYAFLAGLRLVPYMIEEVQLRRRALRIRRVQADRGFAKIYQMIKLYSIPLIAQAIRRAHRIGIAMEAKQFQQKRTYYYITSFSAYDGIFVCIVLICTAVALIVPELPV
ncbi:MULTISPECIES: energy-coupling factor transporter transmembrane component T family protein [Paenibacillus]|uniref:energy-coupling factor transporter transmembrane component T family protein n=1 Tax=Paenibacillus TaxID=44249 RepID=UPI002041BAA6|nr:energy-coupling factor transporter transmembrane component T [Paenibacillus camelliae]MCM3632351.1 energy-coupling factor transporter transmembrane protein EcfT [Paenibacillus camelliae]